MAGKLTLNAIYTRQDVHDLFESGTFFHTSAWGLYDILPVKNKPGDFVFFVNLSKKQAGLHFDGMVSESGVINWQSEPRQRLADQQIQKFIHHNPAKNNIYLFLCTKKTEIYTYMGRLAYHSHDSTREQPVHVQWQILDWNPPSARLQAKGQNKRSENPQSISQSTSTISFLWRGVHYPYDREELRSRIQQHIRDGLPVEATRFRDWYVEMDGQRLSAKWIFHLLTGAAYIKFDAQTARNNLEMIGIQSYPIHKTSETTQSSPDSVPQASIYPDANDKSQLRKIKMGKKRNYIGFSIQRLTDLILDLAQLGEIGSEALTGYGLGDIHLLQSVQSSWAILTPYALVATPNLLNVLPIENRDALNELLHLSNWDYKGWGNFYQTAFHLPANPRYAKLGYDYIYTPKSNPLASDNLWRPAWLVNYMPKSDWDDWEVSNLMETYLSRRESKLYVHSALPIQNIYGGILEVQDAAWKTAFYWLMLQLLILSDPETGTVYDPQISLTLSDGWRDGSIPRLYLQGDYIGDLADCLEALLSPFHWVWVNRSGNDQDQQGVLGLLRLLLKIDIAELGKDGRVQFTDDYRSQLFQSQTKAQLYYRNSKEARDQLRDAIKEISQ